MTERSAAFLGEGDEEVPVDVTRGEYVVSTDKARIDVQSVHRFLASTYWSPEIPESVVRRAIAGSLCFGIYRGAEQVGFARVITDRATYAYLSDVFVLDAHRGRGLAKWMMEVIMAHPSLQGLRRFALSTRDARTLYEGFGFETMANPHLQMEILRRDIYQQRRAE